MRHLRQYLVGAGIGALVLAMVPLSGVIDHSVSGAGTVRTWYNWLANRQSVTLRSVSVAPPDLSDPARAARGVGHYELVCAACHGSPAAPPALFADALSPTPPILAGAERWRPLARVFQTVKYGIHGSAMPAWPVDSRDDEVWDMVAFLERLPDMDASTYRAAAGTGACRDCHGETGAGRDGIPRLDIQTPEYIAAALRDFRAGARASGTMMAAARQLSDADIKRLSHEFGLAVSVEGRALPAPDLAVSGLRERDIPACLSCHGTGARPDYPRLEGQDRSYLKQQLALFAELGQVRGGSRAHVMVPIAKALTPEMVNELADYLAR